MMDFSPDVVCLDGISVAGLVVDGGMVKDFEANDMTTTLASSCPGNKGDYQTIERAETRLSHISCVSMLRSSSLLNPLPTDSTPPCAALLKTDEERSAAEHRPLRRPRADPGNPQP